ncbi:MAG: LacI family DNA-binding transcriptional regulator [Candidatus Pelethousia sp.]|nr:LacI family DNA-binding transcriptional regulator [Candidatus Pelethousia sp.]
MEKQPTIKDVARLCGTSVSTVSRVLNNHPDVSQCMRRQVLEMVEHIRYVPNSSARSTVKAKSEAIAVITRGIGNPFFCQIIKTIQPAINKRQYSCILHEVASNQDEMRAACLLAREKKPRGILFLGGRFNYTPEETSLLSMPFVCCTYTNAFGCLDASAYSSVTIDDSRTAFQAVIELCKRGHRRIAVLLNEKEDHSIGELRYKGYRAALADYGIPFDPDLVECAHGFDMDKAYRATRRLLNRSGRFTALFAISDTMGIAAMKALREAGRQVPADCSVIAIDGVEFSQYFVPTLTTLEQPSEKMAQESVRILANLIEGKTGNQHVVMTAMLRPGGSVKPLA